MSGPCDPKATPLPPCQSMIDERWRRLPLTRTRVWSGARLRGIAGRTTVEASLMGCMLTADEGTMVRNRSCSLTGALADDVRGGEHVDGHRRLGHGARRRAGAHDDGLLGVALGAGPGSRRRSGGPGASISSALMPSTRPSSSTCAWRPSPAASCASVAPGSQPARASIASSTAARAGRTSARRIGIHPRRGQRHSLAAAHTSRPWCPREPCAQRRCSTAWLCSSAPWPIPSIDLPAPSTISRSLPPPAHAASPPKKRHVYGRRRSVPS